MTFFGLTEGNPSYAISHALDTPVSNSSTKRDTCTEKDSSYTAEHLKLILKKGQLESSHSLTTAIASKLPNNMRAAVGIKPGR